MAIEHPLFAPGDIVRHYGEPARVLSSCWVQDYRTQAVWRHAPHWRYRVGYLAGDFAWVAEAALTDGEAIPAARRGAFAVIEGGVPA